MEDPNPRIQDLEDHNPRIQDLEDHNPRIQDLGDRNPKIQDLEDPSPRTQDLEGHNPRIKCLEALSKIRDLGDPSKIRDLGDPSKINDLGDPSKINDSGDPNRIKDSGDPNRIKDLVHRHRYLMPQAVTGRDLTNPVKQTGSIKIKVVRKVKIIIIVKTQEIMKGKITHRCMEEALTCRATDFQVHEVDSLTKEVGHLMAQEGLVLMQGVFQDPIRVLDLMQFLGEVKDQGLKPGVVEAKVVPVPHSHLSHPRDLVETKVQSLNLGQVQAKVVHGPASLLFHP